ncbi:hypothetical protein [Nonomuraea sp. NPDC049309]|uniref:hypothetical protein n=1 Tax=Nonomuraea sp. NPDC049309 TaxID=3364350 RepID=UPI00371FDF02
MKNKEAEETERSGLPRRRLVTYAGIGATLAAAAPLAGGTPRRPTTSARSAAAATRAACGGPAVVARFGPNDWRRQGQDRVIRHTLRDVGHDSHLRVRGTGTDEMEPQADGEESPWEDLWFCPNPVFIRVR